MSTIISTEIAAPEPLIFSDSAAAKVKELMDEEGNADLKLRIYIEGGGCSGFKYNFTFDETVSADDTVVAKKVTLKNADGSEIRAEDEEGSSSDSTVQLIVDPMSLQYLMGATIDYREDIQGAQFVIRNPNAKTTCGCGSSFTT